MSCEFVPEHLPSLGAAGRRAYALPSVSAADEHSAVDRTVRSWCLAEIGVWTVRKLRYEAALQEYHRLNGSHRSLFLFNIEGENVDLLDKPAFFTKEQLDQASGIAGRAKCYQTFISNILKANRLDLRVVLAMDVSDEGYSSDTCPIFAFQKPLDHESLLLPDIDFLVSGFYCSRQFIDTFKYNDKRISAVFAGATTGGGQIDEESVLKRAFPRLRAAMFFRDKPSVNFQLPLICQCDPKAEQLLRSMGFGTQRVTWATQFEHRFLISMDGNGATCSRVVIGLGSSSVLLKYESPHLLYYFRGLIPWVHYIPIHTDQDVLAVIEAERSRPGLFAHIADEGRKFAEAHLSRQQVESYAGCLLRMYADCFAARAPRGTKGQLHSDQLQASANQGDDRDLPGGIQSDQQAFPPTALDARTRPATAEVSSVEKDGDDAIPDLKGEYYLTLLQRLHQTLQPRTYLEIGTAAGDSLALSEAASLAVDPRFAISKNVLGNKPFCAFYQMTSDAFFEAHSPESILGGPVDFSFLDGLHQFETTLRDFMNVERHARANSVICLHDCVPTDIYMATREESNRAFRMRSRHPAAWTGDVWKIPVILTKYRPDLKMYVVNAASTGLVLLTNLNPASTTLGENYSAIVDQFGNFELRAYGLRRYIDELHMMDTTNLKESADILGYFPQ